MFIRSSETLCQSVQAWWSWKTARRRQHPRMVRYGKISRISRLRPSNKVFNRPKHWGSRNTVVDGRIWLNMGWDGFVPSGLFGMTRSSSLAPRWNAGWIQTMVQFVLRPLEFPPFSDGHVEVSWTGGTPKSSIFNGTFPFKPNILGYPHGIPWPWKPPCVCVKTLWDHNWRNRSPSQPPKQGRCLRQPVAVAALCPIRPIRRTVRPKLVAVPFQAIVKVLEDKAPKFLRNLKLRKTASGHFSSEKAKIFGKPAEIWHSWPIHVLFRYAFSSCLRRWPTLGVAEGKSRRQRRRVGEWCTTCSCNVRCINLYKFCQYDNMI